MFVAGVGPVPPEAGDRLSAPGVRVWGIARELARAGHRVRLATVRFDGRPLDRLYVCEPRIEADCATLDAVREVPLEGRSVAEALAGELNSFTADAAVGCIEIMNRHLADAAGDLPLWCDFFGDPMAERQMLARLHEADRLLADQWRTYAPILRRADRLSGCSRYQAAAIIGALGAVGRLNRHTVGEELVHRIAPWIEPIAADPNERGPFLRGVAAPEDAFIILQTGGFNTWLDIETLFAALENVMTTHPRVHFAATGGALAGHNEISFNRLKAMVEASPHRSRFHFLGWVPLGRMPGIIAEADLGLNVDLPSAEGWLGTRNRIMDWLMGGLPAVSTVGTELVEELAGRDMIDAAPQGDAHAVSAAVEGVIRDPDAARRRAEAARNHLRDRHGAGRCLEPLLEWARDPKPASDLQAWRNGEAQPPSLWIEAGDVSGLTDLEAEAAGASRAGTGRAFGGGRLKTLLRRK